MNYQNLGEVIDDFFNVAKGKNTSASSEPWGGKAARAVDGVTNQNWNKYISSSHELFIEFFFSLIVRVFTNNVMNVTRCKFYTVHNCVKVAPEL